MLQEYIVRPPCLCVEEDHNEENDSTVVMSNVSIVTECDMKEEDNESFSTIVLPPLVATKNANDVGESEKRISYISE